LAKTVVYNNSADVAGVYIAEVGMFTFDIAVVAIMLTLGLVARDSTYRYPAWTCAGIYLIAALAWHTYPV
jgi:hypothetical protein